MVTAKPANCVVSRPLQNRIGQTQSLPCCRHSSSGTAHVCVTAHRSWFLLGEFDEGLLRVLAGTPLLTSSISTDDSFFSGLQLQDSIFFEGVGVQD